VLNVSQNFNNSISAFPRTMSALVEFDMVDVAAQNNCTPTATSIAGVGGVAEVTDGLSQIRKYMSEENNYLLLDGSFFTPPKPTDVDTSDSVGWWSAVLSDANGNFATPPVLTLTQSAPFTSLGLTFVFSPLTGDYCNSIQIVTTDSSSNQVTYNVNPTSANYFFSQQLNNIVQVVITFNSTNAPLRRVHLSEVLFGEQFLWTGNNLFDLDVLEELDPLGNSAPPKEAHASIANNLNNFNLYLGNLQKKQPLKPSLNLIYANGATETVPLGTFYLYNWLNDANYLSSTLYARDLLDIADGTTYYAFGYTGSPITLYALAVAVITDFQSQAGMKIAYQIDTALQGISTSGVLSAMSHHDALMYIAQAGMAVVYVDRYNVLHIRQSASQMPLNTMPYTEELTLSMQETYPKIAIQDPYNYFTLNIYSNTVDSAVSNVYTGNVTVNSTITTWVTYTTPATPASCAEPGNCTITGGTLVGATYYANAAQLTITGSGSVGISISGLTITGTSIQQIVNNSGSQPSNEVDLDNPLVTDATMATNILNWYAAECSNVYLYEVESWMDPSLECGDVMFWDSQYATAQKQAKIIRQEFRFNGTLSGTLNGKGWGARTINGSGSISSTSSLVDNGAGNVVYGSGSISAVSSLVDNGASSTVYGSGSISSVGSLTNSGSSISTNIHVTGVTVTPATSNLTVGGTQQLTTTVTPSNATNPTIYYTTDNSAIATVSSTGLITAVGTGSVNVYARANDGGFNCNCYVTVSAAVVPVYGSGSISSFGSLSNSGSSINIPVTWVSVTPGSANLTVGGTQQLYYTLTPSNATNPSVYYTTDNSAIASVSSSGLITAVSPGSVNVYVRSYDGGFNSNCYVTVSAATISVTGVTISPSNINLVCNGSPNTGQYTATVSPSNATNQSVTWSSTDTTVATVSSTGFVTAVGGKTGIPSITVRTSDGGYTASSSANVGAQVTGITLTSSSNISLSYGSTSQMTYAIAPTYATNQNVTYLSSNTSIATVSSTGLITAVGTSGAYCFVYVLAYGGSPSAGTTVTVI